MERGVSGGASLEPIAASYSRFTAGLDRVRGYCVTEDGDSLSLAFEPWFVESGSPFAVPCMRITFRREGEQIILERFVIRSEEHTSELQSQSNLVCRLLLEKKKKKIRSM